jgi:unsaturated rhamnogalacturonyl hydrolase
MKRICLCMIVIATLISLTLLSLPAKTADPGYSNEETIELGVRVSKRVLNHYWRGIDDLIYYMNCSRYGLMIFAGETDQPQLITKMEKVYKPYKKGWAKPLRGHVDSNVFGITSFELYMQTKDEAYLPLALDLANDEYKENREDGLSDYTRFWVDDMWMVGALQIQAYRATGETVYADRAINQLLAYTKVLQRENGLFLHSEEAPHFWGRGNGWAAASMALALLEVPEDHPRYGELMKAYKLMMAELLSVQHESGMWNQLLDAPESYLESSCSGMFLFAMATGVDQGWLPEKEYNPAVYRGWSALKGYVNKKGDVRNVCIGTNRKDSREYYINRPKITGDLHGKAAFLWAATAMYRLENN